MSTPLKKIKTATQDPELKQIFDQKNINNIFNSFILGDEGKTIIDSLLADYTSTTQEEPPRGFSLGSFKKIVKFVVKHPFDTYSLCKLALSPAEIRTPILLNYYQQNSTKITGFLQSLSGKNSFVDLVVNLFTKQLTQKIDATIKQLDEKLTAIKELENDKDFLSQLEQDKDFANNTQLNQAELLNTIAKIEQEQEELLTKTQDPTVSNPNKEIIDKKIKENQDTLQNILANLTKNQAFLEKLTKYKTILSELKPNQNYIKQLTELTEQTQKSIATRKRYLQEYSSKDNGLRKIISDTLKILPSLLDTHAKNFLNIMAFFRKDEKEKSAAYTDLISDFFDMAKNPSVYGFIENNEYIESTGTSVATATELTKILRIMLPNLDSQTAGLSDQNIGGIFNLTSKLIRGIENPEPIAQQLYALFLKQKEPDQSKNYFPLIILLLNNIKNNGPLQIYLANNKELLTKIANLITTTMPWLKDYGISSNDISNCISLLDNPKAVDKLIGIIEAYQSKSKVQLASNAIKALTNYEIGSTAAIAATKAATKAVYSVVTNAKQKGFGAFKKLVGFGAYTTTPEQPPHHPRTKEENLEIKTPPKKDN